MERKTRRTVVQSLGATSLIGLAACAGGQSQAPSQAPRGNPAPGDPLGPDGTYDEDTVLDAARNTFGSGAEGIASLIERLFAENGRPNAYVTGEEAGGGLIAAVRYGGGQLYHKIEGQRAIHWTGPSVGLELGGNASKSFMLVYNLYDTEDIYARYPALEGQGYFVGGLGVNYLQKQAVKIANVRLGIGLRYTANLGYVKFTKKSTINPF
ncbi:MAG: EipA family protein [Pseudomonadota bacterium]